MTTLAHRLKATARTHPVVAALDGHPLLGLAAAVTATVGGLWLLGTVAYLMARYA
jgi:hypothetical protein